MAETGTSDRMGPWRGIPSRQRNLLEAVKPQRTFHRKGELILAADIICGGGVVDLGPVDERSRQLKGFLQDIVGSLLGPAKDYVGADESGDNGHPAVLAWDRGTGPPLRKIEYHA